MNKRQAKKQCQYENMRNSIRNRFDVLPKGWTEIRWTIEWLERKYGKNRTYHSRNRNS